MLGHFKEWTLDVLCLDGVNHLIYDAVNIYSMHFSMNMRGSTIAEQVVALIQERGLRPGDTMPTELELVDQFSVSRNSIREAIRELRAWGIVDVRHGYGTFVGEASLTSLAPSLIFQAIAGKHGAYKEALVNLLEIREFLEVALSTRVAGNLTDAQIDCLYQTCREMRNGGNISALDRKFHHTLYENYSNPLVGQLIDVFWNAYDSVNYALESSDQKQATATAEQHERLVDAFLSSNENAAAAIKNHFRDLKDRIGHEYGEESLQVR